MRAFTDRDELTAFDENMFLATVETLTVYQGMMVFSFRNGREIIIGNEKANKTISVMIKAASLEAAFLCFRRAKCLPKAGLIWKQNDKEDIRIQQPHQINVVVSWIRYNHRGRLEYAIGSGKTFTGLCAIDTFFRCVRVILIFVLSRDLLKRRDKELRGKLLDDYFYRLLHGDGYNNRKRPVTCSLWVRPYAIVNRAILATMDTAYCKGFVKSVSHVDHLLIVADEINQFMCKEAIFTAHAVMEFFCLMKKAEL